MEFSEFLLVVCSVFLGLVIIKPLFSVGTSFERSEWLGGTSRFTWWMWYGHGDFDF